MKITGLEIYRWDVQLKNPFRVSFGVIDTRAFFLVKMTDELGNTGRGETAVLPFPFYNEEDNTTVEHIYKNIFVPYFLAKEISSFEKDILPFLQTIRGHNIAKFGFQMARYNLQAHREGVSIRQLIGGQEKGQTMCSFTLPIVPKDEVLPYVEKFLEYGIPVLKIKTSGLTSLENVSLVRRHYPDLRIRVDFNAHYKEYNDECLQSLSLLKDLGVEYYEQIFSPNDIVYHAKAKKELGIKTALDESVKSPLDLRQACLLDSLACLNLKPARVGGIYETIQINAIAREYSLPMRCGGMLESPLGVSFLMQLNTLSQFHHPVDCMDYLNFYDTSIAGIIHEPIHVSGGVVHCPDRVTVNEEFVATQTTRII